MKIFKLLLLVCFLSSGFYSCETYTDPKIEHSAIFPMSGEWIVRAFDIDADAIVKFRATGNQKVVIYTYNTTDESTRQMWLRMGTVTAPLATYPGGVKLGAKGKVDVDLSTRTFSVIDLQNDYISTASKFTLTDGKVLLDQARPPSGGTADSIYFKITLDTSPGKSYIFSGYRRTAWPEDEPKL